VCPKIKACILQVGIPQEVIRAAKDIAEAVDAEGKQTTFRDATPEEVWNTKMFDLAHKISCVRQAYQHGSAQSLDFKKQMQQLQREAVDILGEQELFLPTTMDLG
jgi:hypothetical protein